MGLDLLDITFRLERRFQINIRMDRLFEPREFRTFGFPVQVAGHPPQSDANISPAPPRHRLLPRGWDITIGEIHDRVCELLREQGRPVPFSSWRRVKICIYEGVGVSPRLITRNSWLVQDLDASV